MRWLRDAPQGLLAGVASGLLLTIILTWLRLAAGVPLLVEAVSDRALPLIPVDRFLQLIGMFGGPQTAKQIAFFSGFAGQVAAGALVGAAYSVLRARRGRRTALLALLALLIVMVAGTSTLLSPTLKAGYTGRPPGQALAVALLGISAAYCVYAAALVVLERTLRPDSSPGRPVDRGRRGLLVGGLTVLLGLEGGLQVASLFGRFAFYDGRTLDGPPLPMTPNESFYVVTKNLIDPEVAADSWRLRVSGQVGRPYELTLAELGGLPWADQETTLECISNGVGYGLLSNALWRGVTMRSLIERALPAAGAAWINLQGVDGYTHSLAMERALHPASLVAYRMNGLPLPRLHGFPARAIVPGSYGEVSVKWLTEIEVTARQVPGYYETQGWQPDFVHTTTRIDEPRKGTTIRAAGGAPVTLRGVAFAGDRGVATVEVSWDQEGWQPARIYYGGGRYGWALWSFDWRPAIPGHHTLRARASDGLGKPQEPVAHGFAPAGATGYHTISVTIAT
jgi:Oxidoreductase molybdopterin binding domain